MSGWGISAGSSLVNEWVCDLKMLVREVFLASQGSRSGREGMPRPPFASFLFFSDTSQVTLLGSFFLLFPVVSEESCIFKYSFSKLSVLKELAADSFRLKPRVMGKERDEEGNRLESQVGVAL